MISHVVLKVRDLELSRRFYAEVLSPLRYQEADHEPGQFARLADGAGGVIVLSQVANRYADAPFHRHHIGLNHIAFEAPTRSSVDEVEQLLTDRGTPLLGDGKVDTGYRGHYYTLAFEDPDRIMIEVVAHTAEYASLTPARWHDDA